MHPRSVQQEGSMFADRNGTVTVSKHGAEFEILATNRLAKGVNASLAVVGSELCLRGENHLYCFAEEKSGQYQHESPRACSSCPITRLRCEL